MSHNKKRSFATMAGEEHNNKPSGADDNDNQALDTESPGTATMAPPMSPTNNDLMVHDHIATTATTASEPQVGEEKDVDRVSGGDEDKEVIDQVNGAESTADHDETVAVSESEEQLGDGSDNDLDAGEGVASAAAAEGREEDEDDEDEGEDIGDQEEGDEEMEDDEDDEEDEEEEEDDPNHVAEWGVLLWRHSAAIEDDGGVPRRFRRGPPLSAAAPVMRRPHDDGEQSDAGEGTGANQNEDEDDEETDPKSNPEIDPEGEDEEGGQEVDQNIEENEVDQEESSA